MKNGIVSAALVAILSLSAIAAELPPFEPDRPMVVRKLPENPGDHWIWVSDMVWIAMTDGRATLVDADSGTVLGMLSTGYSFNTLSLPREYGEIYSAETYYTRYTRGDRTDVITVYDARELAPLGEIEIPPKRMSTTPKLATASLTDDDRFLAVYNFTPAQSFSIIDVKDRKFVGEIPMAGCALAYPVGPRQFFSLCSNGTVQLLSLTKSGELAQKTDSAVFFSVEDDPITEKGVRLENTWFFPSYLGMLHTIHVTNDGIDIDEPWSLVSEADRNESWRIGGIQHLAIHPKQQRLFALMHQGGPDTHHDPGTEVWVYDLASKTRQQRIKLVGPASSIQVSQDDAPLLYSVIPDVAELVVYDAITGEHLRTVPEISITPSLLQLPTG